MEIKNDVGQTRIETNSGIEKVNAELQSVRQALEGLEKTQYSYTALLEICREENKRYRMAITKARRLERERDERRRQQQYLIPEVSQGVMSLDKLFLILSTPPSSRVERRRKAVDIDSLLIQHTTDVEITLARSTNLDVRSHGQVHSLLNQGSFFDWMSANAPDMLLVDGNMQDASSDKISPSLFCTNFALTMANLEPENILHPLLLRPADRQRRRLVRA
ncbi:hypothetical protein B0H67DRAFT_206323 [Lasiosphaeris hirsuta]|uniref:Uncharacterized protein n=1 Tax=Lasiosphaeris hirsuta TaxID=260670 RepID=A0AA40ARW3_9PEZI|nr:hypothetical protein B0H67DRAFT_206323 [Lasiosphaeris hirsuta]